MTEPTLFAFALAAVVIELTPGPNMAYIVLVSALHGWRAGLFVTAGVALGLSVIGLAVAIGFGEVVSSHPAVYQALRWVGFAYLLWLAWDAWRSSLKPDLPHLAAQSHRLFFRRGLITNLLNPKAALFFIAVLPGFAPAGAAMPATALWLTVLYVVIATLVHTGLSLLGGQVQRLLDRPQRMAAIQRLFAVLLAGIAVWFLLATA